MCEEASGPLIKLRIRIQFVKWCLRLGGLCVGRVDDGVPHHGDSDPTPHGVELHPEPSTHTSHLTSHTHYRVPCVGF